MLSDEIRVVSKKAFTNVYKKKLTDVVRILVKVYRPKGSF